MYSSLNILIILKRKVSACVLYVYYMHGYHLSLEFQSKVKKYASFLVWACIFLLLLLRVCFYCCFVCCWIYCCCWCGERTMLDIFRGLKNLVKVSHVRIDSSIFRLHYSLTVMILLAFSLIVTTRQYVGNPIDCIHTKDIPEDVLNTYCWITHTYLVKSAFHKEVGVEVPHFGVDKMPTDKDDMKVYRYYQWVCFCLFFQAILFYIPRWLWKNWEGGKIQALMMDLDVGIIPDMEKKQKKKLLVDYLHDNIRQHNWWAYRYFFCEVLALGNVVGQMFLMDKFFDGEFLTFGLDVISLSEQDEDIRVDPMIKVFPRMTKCIFRKGGPSMNIETHDALCILPLNVVNEKIYIFLWFWFIILGFLSSLTICYRFVVFVSPRIRGFILGSRFRLLSQDVIQTLVKKSRLGDWFLFYMLGQNIDSIIFKEIMHELARKLGHPKDYGDP